MSFELTQETISIYQNIYSGSSEQPIDLDVSLPDYCPDISRVLKCQVVPQITVRSLMGDRLTTEGSTLIRIFYADETGCLRCCELSSAFSSDFHLRTTVESPSVFTNVQVNFMNCRAVTKRRVDIHCAFTIHAQVWGSRPLTFLTDAKGCGIRIKTAAIPVCTHIATVQQPLNLCEEYVTEEGRPAPETILRFSADAIVDDVKSVAGKWIAKGEIKVCVLYETDALSGQTDTMEYAIPFSQLIDPEGAEDDCDCRVKVELLSIQVRLRETDGGHTAFETEIHGSVCAIVTRQRTITGIQDAYSTEYETDMTRETVTLYQNGAPINRTVTAHGVLQNCEAAGVTDMWIESSSINIASRSDEDAFTGRICAAVLLRDAEGKAAYQETVLDLHDGFDRQGDDMLLDPQMQIERIAYRLNNTGQLELRADVHMQSTVQLPHSYTIVTQIEPDLQRTKEKDTACAMILYYAESGESVWDIARRYNTTENAVRTENELNGETVENGGLLLIPVV